MADELNRSAQVLGGKAAEPEKSLTLEHTANGRVRAQHADGEVHALDHHEVSDHLNKYFNLPTATNRKLPAPKDTSPDMIRADGTLKGPGFLGDFKAPHGRHSSELSIGVEMDGKETEIPSLVPGLTNKEVKHMVKGKKPTDQIVDKAVVHAKKRMAEGKSPFKEVGEE